MAAGQPAAAGLRGLGYPKAQLVVRV
jgi:hypothetical protein